MKHFSNLKCFRWEYKITCSRINEKNANHWKGVLEHILKAFIERKGQTCLVKIDQNEAILKLSFMGYFEMVKLTKNSFIYLN